MAAKTDGMMGWKWALESVEQLENPTADHLVNQKDKMMVVMMGIH